MEFFNEVGKMSLGSRLRMLSERITEDARQIYALYEVELKPKWFPVFYILSKNRERSITDIAEAIGHSHPSVSKIVREMSKAGIVTEKKAKEDGRKNIVSLSSKGKDLAIKIEDQYLDVGNAIEEALEQTKHNIWRALEEWEFLLDERSLLERVREQKKKRASGEIRIVPYEAKYRQVFKALNEEWIAAYFKMEEADHKGGEILIALYRDKPVGVCALIKMQDPLYDFELAKMAVSPKARGKGVGGLLGAAIIDKARSLGAGRIYLESNTILKPAINLYRKLGFKKVSGHSTPYERCNIQMELELE